MLTNYAHGTFRVLIILLASALLRGEEVLSERKITLWPKTTVSVYNNLGKHINLNLHCKSKDNDFGPHLLRNGDFFHWKFHSNFWGTTKFTCDMEWKNVRGTFDIYVAGRDDSRCRNCVWKVTEDGVRGYGDGDAKGDEQIWFRWVPKPPPTSNSYHITDDLY